MKFTMQVLLPLVFIWMVTFVIQSCTSGKSEVPPIPKTTDAIPVTVALPERSKAAGMITAAGRLTTENETVHAFKIGGVVKSFSVGEGDPVRKGQVLATLDLTEMNADVSRAKLNFGKAERDLERMKNLYSDSVVTLEQLQNAQTAFDVATEHLTAAEFNKHYGVIRASEDGYVLKKFVHSGEVVGVGQPIVLTNAASPDAWILEVGVSARQWAQLKGNEQASVVLDAFPGQTFKAFVFRTSKSNDPQTGMFTVELKLFHTDEPLASGIVGTARIQTGDVAEFWNVPYEAVLDARGGEGFVFVTRNDKIATKVPVTIRSFDEKYIQVASGLRSNDKLIVSGSAYLDDGSSIIIAKQKE